MNERILLYDVFDDNKNVLNSQVVLDNNIGFEIPSNCYFDKNTTILKDHILKLKNNDNDINIYFNKYDEKIYNDKIAEIKRKYNITEDFTNYRGQKIIEYEDELGINVLAYDGINMVVVNSNCSKYSNEYYELYYIAFSFDSDCNDNYDNSYYQKNSYCIIENAKHLYDEYKVNLIKHNPSETLSILNNESFCNYLSNTSNYDNELNNYYVLKDKVFSNIVNKITNYNNEEFDDPSLMDLIEE